MSSLASPLTVPAWLPWAVIAVVMVGLVAAVAGLIIWRIRKQAAPPAGLTTIAPVAKQNEATEAAAVPESVYWWTPQNRRRPCFLMTGEAGAGTTSLINGLTGRVHPGSTRAEWRMAGDWLLYDVPGAVLTGADSRPWEKTLRALARRRPRRPADGIVLTVAAHALLADAKGDQLAANAQLIRARLDQLRQELGFALPVYVIVTQCDRLAGFDALVQMLGRDRCQEMLGWSSDRRLELSFTREWVDDAFAQLSAELEASQLALIGAGGPVAPRRAALGLPREVAHLRQPLGPWLEALFSGIAGTEPHLLRGIYFCGAPSEAAASTARLFSRDLFHQKIFREGRLARAAGFGTGSRRHWAAAAQVAAVCLALVFVTGLWSAQRRLAPIRDTRLEPLLEDLTQAVSGGRELARARNPRGAVNFLGTIEALESDGFGSLFLPASWGDPVGQRIERLLVPAFQEMVIESCRLALEHRIMGLTRQERPRERGQNAEAAQPAVAAPGKFEDDPNYIRLHDYLRHAGDLESNLVRYHKLSEHEPSAPAELQSLLEYLTGETTSVGTRLAKSRRLRRVLAEANWPAVQGREDFLGRAADRSRRLGEEFLASWLGNSPLPESIGDLSRAIEDFEQGARADAASLESLQVAISEVSAALEGGGWDWLTTEFERTRWGVLGKAMEQAPFASEDLLSALETEGARQQELLFEAVQKAATGASGPVLEVGEEKIRVAASIRALASALARLGSIAPTVAGAPIPAATQSAGFLWNLAELRQAASVEGAYANYQRDVLPALAERFRAPLRRLAAARVRAAAVAQVAAARSVNPAPYRDGADTERTLLPEIRNFAQATDLFGEIARGLDSLGAPAERDALRQVLTAQGTALLTAIDRELDLRRPYASRAQTWDESVPLPMALFEAGSKAELRRFLDAERARLAKLAANYAQPVLASLDKLGADPGREQEARWRQISEALASFADARPGNQVRALERYVEEAADQVRPETGCATAPDAAQAGADLFTAAERSLRARTAELCRAALATRYRKLADFFNTRLGGRYPFTSNPRADDDGLGADSADAARFFLMLDQAGTGLDIALSAETRTSESARQALGFLRRMAALRPFFAIAEGDSTPGVSFSAEFRANRAREAGGNQIIDWALRVGDQPALTDSKPTPRVRWRHGDRTQIELRYAKDSPVMPSPQGLAPGATVDGRRVRFDFVNPWSLLQALRGLRTEASEAGGLAAAAGLLRFRVPNQTPKGDATAPTVVFVRLKLEPGKGVAAFPAAETAFPDRAPGLAADLAWGNTR